MIDTVQLSGMTHSLLIVGVIYAGVSVAIMTRSRWGFVMTVAIGGALLF